MHNPRWHKAPHKVQYALLKPLTHHRRYNMKHDYKTRLDLIQSPLVAQAVKRHKRTTLALSSLGSLIGALLVVWATHVALS